MSVGLPADRLETTRAFWDAASCGAHGSYDAVRVQRYAMEPWLAGAVADIGARHRSILEVGCGQGIDSIELCSVMPQGGRYLGIDYSPASVDRAQRHARERTAHLHVVPEYRVGNAEALDVPSGTFEAVYSMGVLHHTADERTAIREIHRVLQPGGTAYLFLYRQFAPKVAVAKTLRGMQRGLDTLLGTDRCVYRALAHRASYHPWLGTMIHECFGVPYMKWYSRRAVLDLFADFSEVGATSIGSNLGRLIGAHGGPSPFGYFWGIVARKHA